MEDTLAFHKRFWVTELICIILIATTILFRIKGLSLYLALSEIIAIGFFLNRFIYHGIYKRDYKFTELSNRVFWILFSFGVYFLVLFSIRFMLHLPFTDSIWTIKESDEKRLPSWITPIAYANVGMSLVFAFLSGGRLGWVVMGAVIVASFLLIFGAKWNSWKRILTFMISCSLVIAIAASVNFMQARPSLYRSFSAIVTRIPGLVKPAPETEEAKVSTADTSDKIFSTCYYILKRLVNIFF
ncbi:hypothetical protein [Clostridium sp.]|uniref:hypothetical protein n=1 Tax=Clostridium sp. TaxID=1506 RepID=UPI003D6C72DF